MNKTTTTLGPLMLLIGGFTACSTTTTAPPAGTCATAADCATSAVGHVCNAGVCVQCAASTDCATSAVGHVCNAGVCVQCAASTDCPLGNKCTTSHMCVACIGSGDCAAGMKCVGNACVAGCDSSNPCPAGNVCDAVAGVCVQCLVAADCGGATPVCDPSSHSCVGCVADGDCMPGNVCHAQICAAGCSTAHPVCATGQVCSLNSGACVGCVSDTDCKSSTSPRCDTTQNQCVSCLSTNDNCGAGLYCNANTCTTGCKSTADCTGGQQCDIAAHKCVQCIDDTPCSLGMVCMNQSCVAGCKSQAGCPSGQGCCGNGCVAILTDVNNCGACGIKCGQSQACCNGTCKSTATVTDCGSCGNACTTGQGCCGSVCTPTNTVTNCGACGTACSAGLSCCGGACVSTAGDPNCGACGTNCQASGLSCCVGTCVNVSTDNNNCGACGYKGAMFKCTTGSACTSGQCAFPLSCNAILKNNSSAASGIYTIDPDGVVGAAPFQAYCDMTDFEGGWTLAMVLSNGGANCRAMVVAGNVTTIPTDPNATPSDSALMMTAAQMNLIKNSADTRPGIWINRRGVGNKWGHASCTITLTPGSTQGNSACLDYTLSYTSPSYSAGNFSNCSAGCLGFALAGGVNTLVSSSIYDTANCGDAWAYGDHSAYTNFWIR